MKVYIAGPYSAKTKTQVKTNVENAMRAGAQLLRMGHTPFIPHLTHYFHVFTTAEGAPFEYEDYMKWDEVWLIACDAFLYLAPSPGTDRERQIALARGMMVFSDINDIPLAVPDLSKTNLHPLVPMKVVYK